MNNEGRRKILKWIGIALAAIVALIVAAIVLLAVSAQRFQATDEIAANVSIAGIDVSGLPATEAQARLESQLLRQIDDRNALLGSVSRMLSSITSMAGVVTVPKGQGALLRQIEFLPLSDNRVLVILVLNDHEVQNRIFLKTN